MINRIDPLYIGIFLSIILVLSVFKLSSAKNELNVIKTDYKNTQKLVTKLSGLKSTYADRNSIKKSLSRILKLSLIRSAKILKNTKKNSVILSSKSIDKKALNLLMGKLLNGVFQINSFKIKKLDEFKVSFEIEIKW
jgi:hypothetical protein